MLRHIVLLGAFCVFASFCSAEHWSFQPLKPGQGGSIDEFIWRKLAEKGLKPSPRADERTLVRRPAGA